jgi:hypothetical protein
MMRSTMYMVRERMDPRKFLLHFCNDYHNQAALAGVLVNMVSESCSTAECNAVSNRGIETL